MRIVFVWNREGVSVGVDLVAEYSIVITVFAQFLISYLPWRAAFHPNSPRTSSVSFEAVPTENNTSVNEANV